MSGICRPATIRSAAVPFLTLRDAAQPTTRNAAYIATTAATAGVIARASRRDGPELLQEAEHVEHRPVLDDFAVREAEDVLHRHLERLAGRRQRAGRHHERLR